jgi:hypothetical protein
MATTARIALKTGVDTAYTASIASGTTIVLKATGLTGNEVIDVEGKNAAGGYSLITERDSNGKFVAIQFSERRNAIPLTGPLDYRLNKPVTAGSAGVDEYT